MPATSAHDQPAGLALPNRPVFGGGQWEGFRRAALRMHESGGIKLSPQKLIAQGTEWRFKATDLCALDPGRAADVLVARGFTRNREYAVETLRDIPYRKWRDCNPEDTVRFYALKMQEVGMIKASPQKIIAQGTDFRFVDELKRELKG